MLCEADLKASWRARPRGFAALMSLYESNYLRFVRLTGDPMRLVGTRVSRVAGDCEMLLTVLEHLPYTSLLTLTYLLPGVLRPQPQRVPDLRLRVYHDARLLEADEFQHHERNRHNTRGRGSRPAERELHQRWARNMMLNKWLEYCAERGHSFTIR